jgi:hypothetical protein
MFTKTAEAGAVAGVVGRCQDLLLGLTLAFRAGACLPLGLQGLCARFGCRDGVVRSVQGREAVVIAASDLACSCTEGRVASTDCSLGAQDHWRVWQRRG